MSPIAKRRRTDMAGPNSRDSRSATDRAQSPTAAGHEQALRQQQKKHALQQHQTQLTAQAVGEMCGYKSNVFRMETDEMLSQVALNYSSKRVAAVEKTLHQLKAVIDAIPEQKGLKIVEVEAAMKKRKVFIPFPEPKPAKDVQYQFSYAKPSYVNIAGSYALKTLIKQKEGISIDLVLTMPSEIFQEKDYLNYRYFYKRAYYLTVVAAAISDSKELRGLKVEYDLMNEDPLKPIVVVSVGGDEAGSKCHKCTIKIIPSVPPNIFPPGKLYPLKNCVRPQQIADSNSANKAPYDPTPFYNTSLAADTTYFPHLALLHSSSSACAAFSDACVLGRVWLRQRGFGGAVSKGGFGHFEWALLMALLLKGGGPKGHGLLATGYSNYQMFKAMLQFLASRNLSVDPLVFGTSENVKRPGTKVPIVFDGEHGVNVLFKMTSWSYNLLRHEAERTLECLNSTTLTNQFDAIFLQRVDEPCYKFDAVARLSFPLESELEAMTPEISGRKVAYAERVYKALCEGLTDRVSLIHISYEGEQPFAIRGARKTRESSRELTVGFLLNAQHTSRMIDRGPSPEEKKKAAAFRKFWGSKAELRRFPDGSIIESVTWASKSKLPIYQQIIRYIVSQHFGEDLAEEIAFVGEPFTHLIEGGEQGSSLFQPVYDAFDTLDKDLKSLTGIPLAMRHVGAADPALRAATVDLPFGPSNPLMKPADVVVQFESSTRWPDDLVAIQKTKASFLIRMGQLLEEAKPGELITRVGLENDNNPIMNYAFLDVIYLSGPSFRIRIYHDREASLLENRCSNPTLTLKGREAAQAALSAHRRAFVLAPRHTDSIRQLCHRHPLLSPTIRLLKKWFTAQLLSSHVTDEFIEIVAARAFLCPYPFSVPSSAMAGFLHSLSFLAKWDWRTEPLVLDLSSGSDGMKTDDFAKIRDNFLAVRKQDPALNHTALFLATNHDREHSLWTEGNRPRRVVAARMTALARAADEAVKRAGLGLEVQKLFSAATRDFDFVLQLDPKYVGAGRRKKRKHDHQPQFKNLQIEEEEEGVTAEDIAKLSFDPCGDFVEEISNVYSSSAIFFPGSNGVVGAVWMPINVRKWKPNLGYSTVPVKTDSEELHVGLNKPAILNEISRIGGELVAKIVVNRQ